MSEILNIQMDILQAFFRFLITSDHVYFCQQLISNYHFLKPTWFYPLPLSKAIARLRRKKE